ADAAAAVLRESASDTETLKPACTSRPAMGSPMAPTPMKTTASPPPCRSSICVSSPLLRQNRLVAVRELLEGRGGGLLDVGPRRRGGRDRITGDGELGDL